LLASVNSMNARSEGVSFFMPFTIHFRLTLCRWRLCTAQPCRTEKLFLCLACRKPQYKLEGLGLLKVSALCVAVAPDKLIYLLLDLNRTGKARAYLSALGAKKKSCTSQGQLSLTLPEVVIMFFLGAEASNALFFQLFPDFPSAFSVDFASSFQIANYFFGLFFSVASPNEVNDIWHIAIEAPRGHGFLSIL